MSADVVCQGCGAVCDKTELGACVNGVYISCHFCESEADTIAREDREEAENRDRMNRIAGQVK